jgi:protein-disulfide isomerase
LRPTAVRVRLVAILFPALVAACGGGGSPTENQEQILATLKEIAATQKSMDDRLQSTERSIERIYARGLMVLGPANDWAEKSGFLIPTLGSPTKGPVDAPIRVVEFADFECPYCRASAGIGDRLMKEFPGQVLFVFKHYPLKRKHPNAEAAARASIAAAKQNRFWQMHDRIFATGQVEPADLRAHAEAIGLDMAAFDKMNKSLLSTNVMNRDHTLARDVGVQGTPTFYVNGKRVDEPTQDAVMKAVRAEVELLVSRGELNPPDKPQAAAPGGSAAPAAVPAGEASVPAS